MKNSRFEEIEDRFFKVFCNLRPDANSMDVLYSIIEEASHLLQTHNKVRESPGYAIVIHTTERRRTFGRLLMYLHLYGDLMEIDPEESAGEITSMMEKNYLARKRRGTETRDE